MGIFNTFLYGLDSGVLYGNQSKLAYAASPLHAVALSSDYFVEEFNVAGAIKEKSILRPKVSLSWNTPSGSVAGFRILRNQTGFSENEEDGIVVYETFNPGVPNFNSYIDQMSAVPIIPGKYAYYTIWVLLPNNTWYLSARDVILIPTLHSIVSPEGIELISSEEKFVSLLPRSFSSSMQSNLDEVDKTSDLYVFLRGFAYTLDEILTFADLISSSLSGLDVNPNFVSVMAQQLGLPEIPDINLKTQKKLIRQAVYLYQHKGTLDGLSTYVEAITGYAPTLTLSPNVLLSAQDSSFYRTTGNWTETASVTLTAEETGASDVEMYAVDKSYVGRAVVGSTGQSILLGATSPVSTGIPVIENTTYRLDYYAKTSTSGKTITTTVTWHDYLGASISSDGDAGISVPTSWGKQTVSTALVAPAGAVYASIQMDFSAAATYYLDMVQLADVSDSRSSEYHEARAVEVYLEPSKVNYLVNPSFSGTTGWDIEGYTGVLDTSSATTVPGVLDNSHMLKVTSDEHSIFSMSATTEVVPSGDYYTFSIYSKADDTAPLRFELVAYDSVTNEIISVDGTEVSNIIEPVPYVDTSWVRHAVTLFVPEYAGGAYLTARVELLSYTAHNLYFDAAQVERGYAQSDFFDGDYVVQGGAWDGTQNASVSFFYPAKLNKIGNLKNTISQFLPMNTPYVITSGHSARQVEGTGFSS
jgi:phage tail-like protein